MLSRSGIFSEVEARVDGGPSSTDFDGERVATVWRMISEGRPDQECHRAMQKHVGIALSGGGFLAYKHAGALTELFREAERHGHPLNNMNIVSTSGGAVVGGVIGVHGIDTLREIDSLQILAHAFAWQPDRSELFSSDHLGGLLQNCFGEHTRLSDCASERRGKPSVDLAVTVTDVDQARPLLLTADNCDEPIWKVVLASCSIPGVFRPLFMRREEEKYRFVSEDEYGSDPNVFMVQDGGLTCNLPLPLLQERHPDLDLTLAFDALPMTRILRRLGTLGEESRETLRMAIELNRAAIYRFGSIFGGRIQQNSHRLGTSFPITFTRGVTAGVLGTRMLPKEQLRELEESGRLVHVRPSTKGMPVPFMGPPLSEDALTRLTESGAEEVRNVMHITNVHKKIGGIGNHNHLWRTLIPLFLQTHRRADGQLPSA